MASFESAPEKARSSRFIDSLTAFTQEHRARHWQGTFAEFLEQPLPVPSDGVSLLPTLGGGRGTQGEHEYLYWEFQGRQAVRMGNWKAYRDATSGSLELYDLDADPGETLEVSGSNPRIARRISEIMAEARTESELFPLVRG